MAARQGGTCAFCTEKIQEIHHARDEQTGDALGLIGLCKFCHSEIHERHGGRATKLSVSVGNGLKTSRCIRCKSYFDVPRQRGTAHCPSCGAIQGADAYRKMTNGREIA